MENDMIYYLLFCIAAGAGLLHLAKYERKVAK